MKNSILILLIICHSNLYLTAQVDAGDRLIGMHITAPENEDFLTATYTSIDACAAVTHMSTPWSLLETTPGAFDGESVGYLEVANQYYPGFGLKVELNIAVTNTVTREIPEELESLDWDDPLMISHFNVLLDSVFSRISDVELVALLIGNESDIMMGTDVEEVTHFKNFIEAVKVHAEEIYFDMHGTDLLVGTTLTYHGLTDAATSAIYHDLIEVTDLISVTYYHMGPNFHVLTPELVSANWQLLDEVYLDNEKPIHFVECGCPSATLLDGSEEHQAEFISAVFDAWDSQISRVKVVNFFMLHDWSQAFVDELSVYYGLEGNNEFTEYLRTLGLRTFPGAGEDKLSIERLRCEADARNFCDAVCVTNAEGFEVGGFQIFPNPAEEFIYVESSWDGFVSIFDIHGRMVHTQKLVRGVNQLSTLLTEGVYVVRMNNGVESRRQKLVIK